MKIGLGISPMFNRGGTDWSSYWTTLIGAFGLLHENPSIALMTENGEYLIQE